VAGLSSRAVLGLLSLAGLIAGVASGWACANSDVLAHPVATGVARGLIVASMVWVGCYMWARRPTLRFARLLVATGFWFGAGTMIASADRSVFALGRVVIAVFWVLLLYLFLSFPTGRIIERKARWAMSAMAVMTVLLWVPIVLFAQRLPVGGAFVDCRGGACPRNGLMVVSGSPTVGDAFATAANVWTVMILIVGAILVAGRLRGGSRLVRRTLAPPLLVMCAILAITALRVALSHTAAPVALQAAGWVVRAVSVALPFSFLLGMLMGRVLAGEASHDLLRGLGYDQANAVGTRDVLAHALDDPSLRLAVWMPESRCYVDPAGVKIQIPAEGSGRSIWEVGEDGQPLALIIHDPALDELPNLGDAAVAACRLSLVNARLEVRLLASIGELRDSRGRVVSAADAERRRIERDLHDGTQQRLVALQLRLAVLFDEGSPDKAIVRQLEAEAEAALDELRALVHGIYPPVLAERGVAEALRVMALTAPIRTQVDAQDVGHLAPEIESMIYFCCHEAVQNAAKHAGIHATVVIGLREHAGGVTFEVRDDGAGFDLTSEPPSSGLSNLRDRVGAVGGDLEIYSAPGRGTTIVGSVPAPPGEQHPLSPSGS
jgi:signal transduction histidine kinase